MWHCWLVHWKGEILLSGSMSKLKLNYDSFSSVNSPYRTYDCDAGHTFFSTLFTLCSVPSFLMHFIIAWKSGQEFNPLPSQIFLIWPVARNPSRIVFLLLQLLSLIMLLAYVQSRYVLNFHSDKFNNFLLPSTFKTFLVLIFKALSICSVDSSFWLKISTQNNLDLSQEHPHSVNSAPFLPTFVRSSIICFSISSLFRKVKKGVSLSRCNVDCMPSQIAPFAKTLL